MTASILSLAPGRGAPAFGLEAIRQLPNSADPHLDYWRYVMVEGTTAVAPNLKGLPGILECAGVPWPILLSNASHGASYPTPAPNCTSFPGGRSAWALVWD